MKTLSSLLFLFLPFIVPAQNITLDWGLAFGSTGIARGESLCVDEQGNSYVVGTFKNTVDFDPGVGVFNMSTGSLYDPYIVKYSPSGNFIWAKKIGTSANDAIASINTDNNGSLYILGNFSNAADFDPGPLSFIVNAASTIDMFLLKLDTAGNFNWVKTFGTTGITSSRKVVSDEANSLYISFSFTGQLDADAGPATFNLNATSTYELGYMKYDTAGNFIWAKAVVGNGPVRPNSMAIDDNENVYIVGEFRNFIDFDAGVSTNILSSNGFNRDAFILKADSNGNHQWAHRFGGPYLDWAFDVGVDSNMNVILTGNFQDSVDFDPSSNTFILPNNIFTTGEAGFVVKLDPTGLLIWAKALNPLSGSITPFNLIVDSRNYVCLSGYLDVADLDPSPTNVDSFSDVNGDIFYSILDDNGLYVAGAQCGIASFQTDVFEMVVDNNDNFLATGFFGYGVTNFDLSGGVYNLTGGATEFSSFVLKFKICTGDSSSINIDTCIAYTFGGTTLYSTGTYIDTFENANGCDSIVYLNLIIRDSTSSTFSLNACDSVMINNQTYYSSGNYTQLFQNNAGCDSTLYLTINISTLTAGVNSGSNLQATPSGKSYLWFQCEGNQKTFINGATAQTYTPITSGDFGVVVYDSLCSDTTGCVNYIPVSTNDIIKNSLKVYPNPVASTLNISSNKSGTIRLRNINGQVLMKRDLQVGESSLDISHLSDGGYLLEFIDLNDRIIRKRITKGH